MHGSITVLGAGSVGVSVAIHLQQRGWKVSLIDRDLPATETSYGNAGVINASSFMPVNNPALFKKLPGILLNNKSYVRYNLAHIVRNLPWVYHFLRSASRNSTIETAEALAQLSSLALDEHKAFMQRTGNMHRLTEAGWLKVFRKGKGFDATSLDAEIFRQFNIEIQALSASQIRELEPSLAPIYKSGYLITGSASVNNPGALVKEYAERFASDGGEVLCEDIQAVSFSDSEGGKFILSSSTGCHETARLVIAAGPWSGDVLQPLGYRVLLGYERGYHQHFHFINGASLGRPLHDVDSGFIVVPMEQGARITTGVELNHRDAPSNLAQLTQVIPRVREAIDLGEPTDDPIWRGSRPSFPDSRPVIDRAPAHKNLWLAFGHQHIGLMTGPITGKLLSQKITGEKTDLDLTPFRASRWISH